MLIVGERINTSRRPIAEATEKRDAAFICQEARAQLEVGASFLDVNAGTFGEKETENLIWLVKSIRSKVDSPLCIDSSDPEAIHAALEICGKGMMLNSISAEKEKYPAILPLIKEFGCKVVALCLAGGEIPTELSSKLKIGLDLVEALLSDGVKAENIYVDPLIMAIGVDQQTGRVALAMIKELKTKYPDIHTISGLSNISFGLPVRKLLNRTFLTMAMAAGLDAVIMDPLDKEMMATLTAANTLLGLDYCCGEYITAFRNNRLGR
ncbi:dihydropteroate synthase [Candidatus Poribacteria bacterium]|nr:dihydropteroate synthase [Candidatus Poribacteria bacterium]